VKELQLILDKKLREPDPVRMKLFSKSRSPSPSPQRSASTPKSIIRPAGGGGRPSADNL